MLTLRKTAGEKIFNFFNTLLMIFVIIITLYPLLHVLFASISQPSRLIQHQGIILWPMGISFKSYNIVFKYPMIISGYLNTIFYVLAGTTLNLIMTVLAAYVLSRKQVYLKNIIMFFIVFTMFFQGGMIPLYLLIKDLGLRDNRWALILPVAVSAWNIIITRTSFQSVPDSLEESARIDGAKDFTILFRIMIPLCRPVLAVMVLFYGVAHWNTWFSAMLYFRNRDLYPLQLVLREILIISDVTSMTQGVSAIDAEPIGQTIKYATIVVATIPIMCVYPFLQKYFVKGVMIGAIKG